MSEKPSAGYNYMPEEPGAGAPPPYGIQQPPQQGYPPAQQGYPPAQQGYPPAQQGYPPAQQGYPPPQPVMAQPTAMQQTSNTTVVVTQPAPMILQQGMRDWSSDLCGCFEDCYSLCMGLFCPCFLLCDVSQRMGEGCCFATCCPGALVGLRIKLRAQQNIQGSLCNDFCVVQCCGPCVLCQLSRELNHLGVRQ